MHEITENRDQNIEEKEEMVLPGHPGENNSYSSDVNRDASAQRVNPGSIENDIIALLTARSGWSYTFSGIRRILGAHQQTLTNALDRLVDDSILVKDRKGYQLNSTSNKDWMMDRTRGLNSPSEWYSLNDTIKDRDEITWTGRTPLFISVASVAKKMAGRWFGSFRFTGSFVDNQKNIARLEWVDTTDNASRMNVDIRHDSIKVTLRNIDSETGTEECLNFVQGVISKLGVFIYFEMDQYPVYGHGEEYNN